MKREDYQVLTIKYSEMRERFIKGRKLGWFMLLILLVFAWGCASLMASQISYEPWKLFCRLYGIITAIIAVVTNFKLILSKKIRFTELDMAFYCVADIGAVMLGLEIMCIGITAETAVIPALIFGGISVILCIGFWITVRHQNYKKLKEGAFRGKSYIMKLSQNVWIWYFTALPIIPLLSLVGRKRWFVSLQESLRILLLMYAILWFWMVLIYSLFAQAGMYIELEIKMRKSQSSHNYK